MSKFLPDACQRGEDSLFRGAGGWVTRSGWGLSKKTVAADFDPHRDTRPESQNRPAGGEAPVFGKEPPMV